MSVYPIMLTGLDARRCVVIGGGAVAARKVLALIEAGAHPIVISPDRCSELEIAVADGLATMIDRSYVPGDLEGAELVVAATDDATLNRQIAEECRERRVLLNVVDCPDLCSFYVPAVIRRGDLALAISTDGRSPALARHIRERLEDVIDSAYGDLAAILAELRPEILKKIPRADQGQVWDRLLSGDVLETLRAEGSAAALALARSIVESGGGVGKP